MYYQCIWLIFFYMVSIFIIAQLIKDNSIIDIGWGLGFVLIACYSLWQGNTYYPRQLLLSSLVMLWGIRLGGYLFLRWRKKGEEDFRYKAWRKTWKYFTLRSFFQIFMLQGSVMLIIAAPIIYVNEKGLASAINPLDIVACALWGLGFFFQVSGDMQLSKFKKEEKNKGKIMRYGVWKYTRHPNYFGEAIMWWAIYLIAANNGGYLLFYAPMTIHFFLLFVSGVPMLERKYKDNEEYQDYMSKTNRFIPWFPKSNHKAI